MRLLPYGPRAVLAEFSTLAEVMAVARACNPTFEPAIREREQRAPEALQAEFSLIRTRCESIR